MAGSRSVIIEMLLLLLLSAGIAVRDRHRYTTMSAVAVREIRGMRVVMSGNRVGGSRGGDYITTPFHECPLYHYVTGNSHAFDILHLHY